ncbi:FadR/GntR family transcriptional regulator [Nitrospirillum sp. BR 11163]|uniref:FadR/GntR family transcriptional regulator n=1 Tax=Nitrospirillum sp. BR 11163 TaxID=3104323 RepID=UPI002AFF1BAF|nr:FadR/GntR family transcriptional regulator [Nitrospirillum sp. BR 11163]MEA1676023.1 FadR/GntR family transcriptional regulator [Nitrospirillum sp. BR 11163]
MVPPAAPLPTSTALRPLPSADRIAAVSAALAAFIAEGALQPGERLPTERELMARLAVGRSTVREVIRQFQARGLVETRKGSGTYLLRAITPGAVHVSLTIDAGLLRDRLLQTLEIRRGLEVAASEAAARRATPADLAVLEEKLEAMERVHLEQGTAGPEDLQFHLAIYDATHNPLFRQLLEQFRETFEHFFDKPFDRPDFARRSFALHRELFDAIRAGDPEAARLKTLGILAIVEEDIQAMSPTTGTVP